MVPSLAAHLFSSLATDEFQVLLFPLAEKRVLEYETFVFLFDFVKVVHVELGKGRGTWRTKEEKLEWRKYLGRISRVNETTS